MTTDAAQRAYLRAVEGYLSHITDAERDEILGELASHIAEGERQGRPPADILASLGEARTLARAYEVELSLQRTPKRNVLDVAFRVIGVLAALGIPTIVIVTVLAVVGVACTVAGAGAFLMALFEPVLPSEWMPPDFNRTEALVWGVPLVVLGVASLGALIIYIRGVLRLVTQTAKGLPLSLDWSVLPRWLRPKN